MQSMENSAMLYNKEHEGKGNNIQQGTQRNDV